MKRLTKVAFELGQSAVAWSWIMNGLRLTAGVVVLPLLAHRLVKPEFDTYFILLSLSSLVPLLDLGFASSIGRAVSYAMGGARELKSQGFSPDQTASGPNRVLLNELLHTTQSLYRRLSVGTLLLVGGFGTMIVARVVSETTAPAMVWGAWALTLVAMVWEIYSGWWNVFLRNMDQVLASTQQLALAQAVKILLSCVFLIGGGGLLSVPIATLVSAFLQRQLARRCVTKLLGESKPATPATTRSMVATLWPNSWRVGLQLFSGYLAGQANTLVCLPLLGLAASGTYGFSFQLILICSGMAQVWTLVAWPAIGRFRVKQDNAALRRLIWPRVWLQYLTYVVLALTTILALPAFLEWRGSEKTLLPPFWLGLLALHGFLEMNYVFWGTLISTENRTPFTGPIILSNLASFFLGLALLNTTPIGVGALILSPLVVNSLYNYWKWPRDGAQSIGTSWPGFLLRRL